MKRRPVTTVLYLGAESATRVDLPRGDAPPVTVERPRRGRPDADAARELLALSRPAREVVVLAEALKSQTVRLPRAATAGLSDDELATAIAFEVEPFSGIPATSARVAAIRTGEDPESDEELFWTTLCDRGWLAALADAVLAAGGRMVACAHPAGLGSEPGDAAIEVYEDVTLCRAEGEVLVVGARPGQTTWERTVGGFLSRQNGRPVRFAGAVRAETVLPLDQRARVDDLGPLPRDVVAVCREAAARVSRRDPGLPVLRPERRAGRMRSPLLVSLIVSVAIAAIAAVDHARLRREAESLERDLAEVSRSAAEQRRTAQARSTLAQRIAKDRAERDRLAEQLAAIETTWDLQRRRLYDLLDRAARLRPEGVALRSIEPDADGRLVLSGLAATPAAADAYADALMQDLRARGMRVRPAESSLANEPGRAPVFQYRIAVEFAAGGGT